MTTYCPDCLEPVNIKPSARDGRCDQCKPQRVHSPKRMDSASQLQQYVHRHHQQRQQATQ